ncbi:hypothetical protein V2J09_013036 [Rumex salicifolius]
MLATPYAPKPTDAHIVEISDDEEEEEEKQIPTFASPSSVKCPPATKRKSEAAIYSAEKQLPEAKRCKYKLMEDAEQIGIALGKFLTDGDPEGRMNKSLADLVREDPKKGLFHCKFNAQSHHDVLSEIYSNNLDPGGMATVNE